MPSVFFFSFFSQRCFSFFLLLPTSSLDFNYNYSYASGFAILNESITFGVLHFTTIHLFHAICMRFALFCSYCCSCCCYVTSSIDDFCVFTQICLILTLFFPSSLVLFLFFSIFIQFLERLTKNQIYFKSVLHEIHFNFDLCAFLCYHRRHHHILMLTFKSFVLIKTHVLMDIYVYR